MTIAIGNDVTAGNSKSIAIGNNFANANQVLGDGAIGIGYLCYVYGHKAICMGYQAAAGESCVSIGWSAGMNSQNSASNSIAIGRNSGRGGQEPNAIAIGYNAGYSSQKDGAIAIGREAGENSQKEGAIAIGKKAGENNQPSNAIAIGKKAGEGNSQTAAIDVDGNNKSSIILNATGVQLGDNGEAGLFINPVRNNITGNTIYYNISTKELTYGVAGQGAIATANNHVVNSIITYDSSADTIKGCLLYTSPSPRDVEESRMPSSA